MRNQEAPCRKKEVKSCHVCGWDIKQQCIIEYLQTCSTGLEQKTNTLMLSAINCFTENSLSTVSSCIILHLSPGKDMQHPLVHLPIVF